MDDNIIDFLRHNLPFVHKDFTNTLTSATKPSSTAWGLIRKPWKAEVAIPDPQLIGRLCACLDRKLATMEVAELDGFITDFNCYKNGARFDPAMDDEASGSSPDFMYFPHCSNQ